MSAGLTPEGLPEYVDDVRETATHILQLLSDHDNRLALPALIMATVALVYGYVEEGHFKDMDTGINLAHDGLEAMKKDYIPTMLNS